MKASELIGAQLDYWVAKGLGYTVQSSRSLPKGEFMWTATTQDLRSIGGLSHKFSEDWGLGGPIIDRFNIIVWPAEGDLGELAHALGEMDAGDKTGWLDLGPHYDLVFLGPTKLIAAMRAFVRMQFGEDLPDEG